MLFLCFSCNNWWILSKFGHKTCEEEVVTFMDKPMETPIEWKWFIPHLRENILILLVLFVRCTKVSTYLRFLLYTTKVCGFIFFFCLFLIEREAKELPCWQPKQDKPHKKSLQNKILCTENSHNFKINSCSNSTARLLWFFR